MKISKSINYARLISFLALIMLPFFSCQSNTRSEMMSLLGSLEDGINQEKLAKFKLNDIDSAGKTIDLVYEEVERAFCEIVPDSKLRIHLDSIGGNSQYVKVAYLAIALHFYCNDKAISTETVLPVFRMMAEYDFVKIYAAQRQEKQRIAKINDAMYKIGDTITIYPPAEERFGITSTFYFTDCMPAYPAGVDSVKVLGIILDKKFGSLNPEGVDSLDLVFTIELLEIGTKNVWLWDHYLQPGDTTDLHVTRYCRIIR